jgi:hypothetical protein
LAKDEERKIRKPNGEGNDWETFAERRGVTGGGKGASSRLPEARNPFNNNVFDSIENNL